MSGHRPGRLLVCHRRARGIRQDDLHGAGRPGDPAPAGAIELDIGPRGEDQEPYRAIAAGKLEVLAQSAFERFAHATRWVKETFRSAQDACGRGSMGAYDVKAGRILERADGDVKIDGSKIHLG